MTMIYHKSLMPTKELIVESRAGARDGQRVIVLKGHLTMECVYRFESALRESKTDATIVDLSRVEQIDSTGLGSIIIAHVSHERAGGRLALVGVPGRVAKLLEVSGLSPVFTTFDTVERAEAALA
jgi:anti-sigma B factor antagonist